MVEVMTLKLRTLLRCVFKIFKKCKEIIEERFDEAQAKLQSDMEADSLQFKPNMADFGMFFSFSKFPVK